VLPKRLPPIMVSACMLDWDYDRYEPWELGYKKGTCNSTNPKMGACYFGKGRYYDQADRESGEEG